MSDGFDKDEQYLATKVSSNFHQEEFLCKKEFYYF